MRRERLVGPVDVERGVGDDRLLGGVAGRAGAGPSPADAGIVPWLSPGFAAAGVPSRRTGAALDVAREPASGSQRSDPDQRSQ